MFKVPEHPTTPISSKTKDIATDDTSNTDEKTEPVALNNNIRDVASKTGTALTPIPYTEPSWGGLPDVLYSLEVCMKLKNCIVFITVCSNVYIVLIIVHTKPDFSNLT